MKASDLREKSVEDLRELQASLARDTFQNRLKNFTNRLDDTSQIRKTKRELARVITLLRERSTGSLPAAPAAAAKAVVVEAKAVAVAAPVESASEPEAAPKKKKSAKKSEAKQS
jgi:large subunit ribosomal protein L29